MESLSPQPFLIISAPVVLPNFLPLNQDAVVLGSGNDCDFHLGNEKIAAPYHALIRRQAGGHELYVHPDAEQRTRVNGERMLHCLLQDGDVIQIGPPGNADITITYHAPSSASQAVSTPAGDFVGQFDLTHAPDEVIIGRTRGCEIILDHLQVSRRHAAILRTSQGFELRDLNSMNHTYVNGLEVRRQLLFPGDSIRIVHFTLLFDGTKLIQFDEESSVRLDVLELGKVAGNVHILQGVSFSVMPREFVALVGPSGAGKSTLLDAINGFRPASSGRILFNGRDLYANYDAFRSLQGYVPQADILHAELPVEQALRYAARLRLPRDVSAQEIDERVTTLLDDLGLSMRRDLKIARLSGGQRKRVSLALELITRPAVVYLDEPTSGLDPGTELRMMRTFRQLADNGRTVLLVTHATQNIRLCDKIAFLVPGGMLAFYGSPAEALDYFAVDDFAEIYVRLEEKQPGAWQTQFRSSQLYQKNIEQRLPTRQQAEGRSQLWAGGRAPGHRTGTSLPHQFGLLTRRCIEILLRDRRNLAILVLQAPSIAALLALVSAVDGLRSIVEAPKILMMLIATTFWFGTINACREIVKELPIYQRERLVNLGIAPYLFSKFVVLALLCVVQNLLLLGIVATRVTLPGAGIVFPAAFEIYFGLLLTSLAGVSIGLMISASAASADRAVSLVPLVLIPQLLFAGVIFDLNGGTDLVSHMVVSKWALHLLGSIANLNLIAGAAPDFPQAIYEHTVDHGVKLVATMILGFVLAPLVMTAILLRRHDPKR